MTEIPSTPFSSGMEYEFFLETHCYQCKKYKENEIGFPEYPENGGCAVLDLMERARFDINKFPSNEVVTVFDDVGKVINWHKCINFESAERENRMI